ncbi:MAG: hypothetical protein ACK5RG_16400 [Cyclobacteriaceae bacterium]|jgi:hypothetical protein|nr:hypothetical protein [Flammeovirgaceae bacterium]
MNTKVVMSVSAVTMGLAGLALSFLPAEVLSYLSGGNAGNLPPVTLQLLGALYFAFAMINWTAKGNLIGGIYARPVAIGNLSHFTIGALALLKSASQPLLWVVATVYVVFAVAFGIIFFTHPVKEQSS